MLRELPVYDALIPDESEGMFVISLVEFPAVEKDFVAFSKQSQAFSIESEERRMVTGVVMRANYPMYRIGPSGYEYYVKYSPDTIRQMAEKFLKDGCQNQIDLEHDGVLIHGVQMVECFIKDSSKGIVPKGFEDVDNGSLFATYHITDDNVWNAVKDGTFRGFSLEGFFSFEESFRNKEKKIISKMSKILKLFVRFAEIDTDKGVLSYAGDGEISVGDEVFADRDGEAVPAEDGEYVADGKVIVVADGKVAEIREKENVEEVEVEVEAEEVIPEEVVVPETVETPNEIEAIKEDLKNIHEIIGGLKADIEGLRDALAEIVQKPAVEPIQEEFNKVKTVETKLSKAERIASFLK